MRLRFTSPLFSIILILCIFVILILKSQSMKVSGLDVHKDSIFCAICEAVYIKNLFSPTHYEGFRPSGGSSGLSLRLFQRPC